MFKNMNIFVFGMARSGYEAAKVLIRRNNKVIVYDSNENQDINHINELHDLGVELRFGNFDTNYLNNIHYVIKNPGIKDSHEIIVKAKELGIPVINEVELAYKLLPKVTLIGITGTNGKTTTTTLTYEIIKRAFPNNTYLAGNIGYPLCSIVDKVKENDIIVMEFSCQQSVNIIDFHPNIGLITNFSEAHIDFFGTYDKYKMSKSKMLYNQNENDIAILNYNDKDVLECTDKIISNKKYFSSKDRTDCYLKDNCIYYKDELVIKKDIIKIPGIHNIENVLAAISIAKELNVSNDIISEAVSNFIGVKHRLEYIDTINNVRYYNDTEATNIKCTQIALSSFDEPTIIILGGLERGQNFDELIPYMNNVKAIIGIGECRKRVEDLGTKLNINTFIFEYLKDSFDKIKDIAVDGDVVLLSPASASWDQYKECEVRGDEFRLLVQNMKYNK